MFHPWTHIIGLSGTYNDYDFTGLVFRLEQSFSTKEPRQFSPASPERLLMQQQNCPFDPVDGVNHCTAANGGNLNFNASPNEKDFATRAKRYAQVWRSKVREEQVRLRVYTDPHAPGEFRVIGPLSNLPEFHATFSCSAGAPMSSATGRHP